MLPISLTLQGVYSYQEEQFINFEELTATGLFGIFGAVGSGKSTILEAISVALYGENDRLDTTNFWYNLLNLKSDKAFIIFEFEYEGDRYKFEARWRRNAKKFHDIPFKERNGYKQESGTWVPVSNNAAEILGLSYDHFKRTIIIPQGQFREFLELKPKERRTMIKEVFDLQRFDLSDKINTCYKDTEARRLLLEGELKAYISADPEQLQVYEGTIVSLREKLDLTEQHLEKEEALLRSVITLNEKWTRLQSLRREASDFQTQLPGFLLRKQYLQTYINAQTTFKGYIDRLTALRSQSAQQHMQGEELRRLLQEQRSQKADSYEQYQVVKNAFDRLADKHKQVADFDTTIQLITCYQQREHLQKRLLAGQDHILHKKRATDTTAAAIQEVRTALEYKAAHPLNYELIRQIDQWLLTRDSYVQEAEKIKQQLYRYEQGLQQVLQQFPPYPSQRESYTSLFEQQRHRLRTSLKELRDEEQQLLIRSGLQQYAHSLEDGCPCPLCGAVTHPHILQTEDLTTGLAAISNRLQACQEAEGTLEEHWKKCDRLQTEADGYRKLITELQQALTISETSLSRHEAGYAFDTVRQSELSSYPELKQSFFSKEKEEQILRTRLENLQTEAERHRLDLTKFEEGISTIDKQVAALEAAIKIHFSNIAVIDANYYIKEGIQAVMQQKQLITSQIQETEIRYHHLSAILSALEQEISKTEGQLEQLSQTQEQLRTAVAALENLIQAALVKSGFETQKQVVAILEKQLPVQQEQDILDHFFQSYNTLQATLQELETFLNGQTVDQEALTVRQNSVTALQQEKDTLVSSLSATTEQAALLSRQLREQQVLQQSYNTVAARTSHLDTLRKLFIGDKFIEFVSRTYLVQLCSYANERFHRLTRHQLSLQLNDQYEFEITDYLNGGKSRSIKTLSGGQAFQASLCMALALAESVQAKSSQERNFFFIDEGFGTQDKATLRIVFETLDSLRKENRIVGIISHVEELQENIPKYISVEKDDSRGSFISQF